MTVTYDYETAQMIRDRNNYTSSPVMVIKKKVGAPAPDVIVSHYGKFVRKNAVVNHADILGGVKSGAALGSVVPIVGNTVGGIVGGAVALGKSIGDLFKKKPVGDKGWQSFLAVTPLPVGPQYYPTMSQILNAKGSDGKPMVQDAKQIAAIQATYNNSTGRGSEGDWHFQVTNADPIQLDWYKGDTEHFKQTSVQAAPVATIVPSTPISSTPSAMVAPVLTPAVNLTQLPMDPPSKVMSQNLKPLVPAKGAAASVAGMSLSLDNPVMKPVLLGLAAIAIYLLAKKMM